METLKPPEYRRNERGQFDRPGKTLAKTAKVRRTNGEVIEKLEKTKFGNLPGPGPGRPKGSQAKVTVALKEAILRAGEIAGGEEGLTGYLVMLARDNSSAYAGLLAKILPSTLSTPDSNGGVGVEVRFIREIVRPSGRREIEGVSPKQLASPDASPALPRTTDPTDDTNEGAV